VLIQIQVRGIEEDYQSAVYISKNGRQRKWTDEGDIKPIHMEVVNIRLPTFKAPTSVQDDLDFF